MPQRNPKVRSDFHSLSIQDNKPTNQHLPLPLPIIRILKTLAKALVIPRIAQSVISRFIVEGYMAQNTVYGVGTEEERTWLFGEDVEETDLSSGGREGVVDVYLCELGF